MARLAWRRRAVRAHLFGWRGTGFDGPFAQLEAYREPNWESDLLYSGSLGLVLALETELGSTGLKEMYREIFLSSPETDEDLLALIERRIGKPIREAGLMQPEARERLLESLLERARNGCRQGETAPAAGLPFSALGHFPEQGSRVIPALTALALCGDVESVIDGITGLRLLGRTASLREAIRRLRVAASPDLLAAIEKDGRFVTAERFCRDNRRGQRWFEAEGVDEARAPGGE